MTTKTINNKNERKARLWAWGVLLLILNTAFPAYYYVVGGMLFFRGFFILDAIGTVFVLAFLLMLFPIYRICKLHSHMRIWYAGLNLALFLICLAIFSFEYHPVRFFILFVLGLIYTIINLGFIGVYFDEIQGEYYKTYFQR